MGRIERKQQAAADKKTPKKRKKRKSFKDVEKGLADRRGYADSTSFNGSHNSI